MDTTVNELISRYEIELLPKLSDRTRRDYTRYTLPAIRARWGERIADDIPPREFGEFLWSSPKGQHARTRMLAPLGAAYRAGKGKWWIVTGNPLAGLQKPRGEPRDRLVLDAELATFLTLCPQTIKLACRLALLTGQRQGDLLRLRWSQIKGMEIHLQQSKTGKRLAIGINSDLEAVLDECWKLPRGGHAGADYVIVSNKGTRYSSEGFRACFTRLQRTFARLGNERFTYHDLRGAAATKCATPEDARRLLGHTTVGITMRVYRRGIERVEALKL